MLTTMMQRSGAAVSAVTGFVRISYQTASAAYLTLAILAGTAFLFILEPPAALAADPLKDFNAKARNDWSKPFDPLIQAIVGNMKTLAIVLSAIMIPFYLLMMVLHSRSTHKVKSHASGALTVFGVLMGVLWLGTIVGALVITPNEAKALKP